MKGKAIMDGQQSGLGIALHRGTAPACTAACRACGRTGLIEHLRRGDFKAAHALFTRVIPFPAIVGRICDHPCEPACRRREAGDGIHIHELERTIVAAGFSPPRWPGRARQNNASLSSVPVFRSAAAAELVVKGIP